ncbi:ALGX domain-containing protein [Rhodovastum atsumiense]|uniref:AlgX/AlgJ SGNH hydrolase-like domain-containing protein n=1 Tax=Rhodovastum atsumiense TaxID=504468 RepID=A0A5M6IXI7_9PROT|nr:hypothetical protein [Rhodovastum atsumiense]KAA5613043.1 hypothetical protein F1189_06690 [Rhodovastum atsumiense]CAH2600100.1 ALGX domain-containing protein [Rhodovastum atsumiense]
MRRLASRLPVLLGAAVLVLPWLYLTWNTTVGELVPRLRFRTKNTIAGVLQEAAPQLSMQDILSYRFQRQISEAVGRLSPVYATAIRLKGQLYYQVLDTSPHPAVVIGRDRQLLQPIYLREYCARDLARFAPMAENWAIRLRQMQDFFTGRGQAFLYVITPSKVALYPQVIPRSYSCPSGAEDRVGKMRLWRAALERHGVRFLDGVAVVTAARDAGAPALFPRGGIHWNWLGAALVAQALTEAVNRSEGAAFLTPFRWDVRMSDRPRDSDRDVLDILNLAWPDDRYPVPELTYHADPPALCRPARIAEIGGSFLFRMNEVLARVACPPVIDMWFYWKNKHLRYPPVDGRTQAVDPQKRRELLDAAELVIFEENETLAAASEHGPELLAAIEALRRDAVASSAGRVPGADATLSRAPDGGAGGQGAAMSLP